jgi:hypothetical protein
MSSPTPIRTDEGCTDLRAQHVRLAHLLRSLTTIVAGLAARLDALEQVAMRHD